MQREKLLTGSILMGLGIWFLLANLGLLSWQTLGGLTRFWPALLVLVGLDLMVRRSRFWWVTFAAAVLFFAAVIGYGVSGARVAPRLPMSPFRFHFTPDGNPPTRGELSHSLPNGAKSGRVKLSIGASNVRLRGGSAGFYDVRETGPFADPPFARYSMENDQAVVRIWQPGVRRMWRHGESDLEVAVTDRLPLDIQIDGGASDLDLDLAATRLDRLTINAGASGVRLKLGNRQPRVDTEISAGASKISLAVPRGAGLRVETSGVVTNNNLREQGLQREGEAYVSPGYAKAPVQITLHLSAAASDLSLDYY